MITWRRHEIKSARIWGKSYVNLKGTNPERKKIKRSIIYKLLKINVYIESLIMNER